MIRARDIVNNQLMRNAMVHKYAAGIVSKQSVCDADPYLISAAHYHGEKQPQSCPICGSDQVYAVHWCFGNHLKDISGSARPLHEINALAQRFSEFTVHEVEVCTQCRWNYLVKSYTVGRPRKKRSTKKSSTS